MIKVCFVEKPVILCAPEPRSLELIFTVENLKVLQAGYQLIEVEQDDIANLSPDILAQVSYIICACFHLSLHLLRNRRRRILLSAPSKRDPRHRPTDF